MTAFNFAFSRERFFACADSAVSDPNGERVGTTSKLHAIPHLRCVVVSSGMSYLLARFIVHILWTSRARTVDDLIEEAPEVLRSFWASDFFRPIREANGFSQVLIAGANSSGRVGVCLFSTAKNFAPLHFTPGVFMMPPLRPVEPAPSASEATDEQVPADEATEAEPPAELSWREQVRRCVGVLRQQRAESLPGVIGDMCYAIELTEFTIKTSELFDLDEAPEL